MNQILTDILGLLKRKKVVTNAKDTSLIPLSGKKTGSLGLSGPNPSEDITLITAKDFATNYIAPNVQPTTNNTVYGLDAFDSNTTGGNNTAIGYNALTANTTGDFNTAVGGSTLEGNTTGANNIAVGVASLLRNTVAVHNVGVGVTTLFNTIDGSDNAAFGQAAGYSNVSGDQNTCIGNRAGVSVVSGSGNTFLGSKTGEGPAFAGSNTGSDNIVIGKWSDHKNFSNTVVIGIEANATADSQFVVGSGLNPLGTIAAYTGAAAETWEVLINGVTKRIMLAP